MSELRVEMLVIPAAEVGPENPLPPLKSGRDIHATGKPVPGIPEEMLRNMAYGRVSSVLPYTMQDRYTRDRAPRAFKVAVLENEFLRATFLLERGGRLWSLTHKSSGRELLDTNPVFQPANLALRNAWFSGGVEWNIGTTGHCPFTCSPIFAARLETPEGVPVLRMYEWERIRQVPFQIDVFLPDGSRVLFVSVRITNPHAETVPMYWWSNIAVPETARTRVLVPASEAYSFGYGGRGLARVSIPDVDGVDISYPTNIRRAADFFFHVPDGARPWVTALDEHGRGLIQTSTRRLKGRKLFLWGMGDGGRRWQTFLSQPGQAYIEIQAGLARTQLEHLPMPARTEWRWLEAYGLMAAEPDIVHGSDWSQATAHVGSRLESLLPDDRLMDAHAACAAWLDTPPAEVIQRGSGWGALEQVRRQREGRAAFCTPALSFDKTSLGGAQAPWVALLESDTFPAASPLEEPAGYVVAPAWRERLEAVARRDSGNWFLWMHLGVLRYHAGDRDGARDAWERSVAAEENPWAQRNLALLACEDGLVGEAVAHYSGAVALLPGYLPLLTESGRQLIDLGRGADWLALLDAQPDAVRTVGRVRLLEGRAALQTDELDRIPALFDGTLVVDDLREGERSLSDIWLAYHAQRISRDEGVPVDDVLRERVRREHPVPDFLDFRMSGDK